MAHDPKKKQRLSDFDFSSPDAHVAVVGKAANGKEKFLVVKNLNPVQKQDFLVNFQDPAMQKVIEAANEALDEIKEELKGKPVVELALEDMLSIFFYMWGEDAKKIAEAVVMKAADSDKDALRKALLARLQSGSDLSGAAETDPEGSNVNKSEEVDMTDKAPEQAVQEAVNKAISEVTASKDAEIADLKKALDAFTAEKDAVLVAKYTEVAKGLKVIGAGEQHGKVLKAIAGIEGGEEVLAMLQKAVDLISKGAILDEAGVAHTADSEDKAAKLASIAKGIAEKDGLTYAAAYVKAAEQNPHLR